MIESITIHETNDNGLDFGKVYVASSSDRQATDSMLNQAFENKKAFRIDLCVNHQIRARWRRYDEKWYRSVI